MIIVETTMSGGSHHQRSYFSQFCEDIHNRELNILNIYPSEQFQMLLGFGGAITEASGYVYSHLPRERQNELIEAYYGTDGLGYTLGRCHIDSCDFSLNSYSADDACDDEELNSFSLSRDELYILPLLREIQKMCPEIRVMLSPWSPPAYMKENGSRLQGGALKTEYYGRWARYLCKYVLEFMDRGHRVFALSVQNEPNAVQSWESCIYSAEQERDFIRDALAPELRRCGLSDLLLTIWDHNKERLFDRVDTICSDPVVNMSVGAAGFHWYSGDHFDALRLVRNKYPDLQLIFTEGCIEYSKFSGDAQMENAQRYAREILHGINAGLNAFLDWNILLDAGGGPNHKGNFCDAPVMADMNSGSLQYNLSYHYIGHFSRYVKPMAVRLGTTSFHEDIGFCALQNPDGTIVAVLLNTGTKDTECYVRLNKRLVEVHSTACSITSLLIPGEEAAGE